MKQVLFLFMLSFPLLTGFSQERYFTKTAHIRFYSHTPAEDIEAGNNMVSSIIDTKSGNVAFTLLMKSFEFKKALMQEHFNENYAESDKFPKATFSGKVVNFNENMFSSEGTYNVQVEGDLTIHGVTNKIRVPGTISFTQGVLKAKSSFNVSPEDYDIKIPGLVREKIAKNIEVSVEAEYKPYKP
ncbi:MAG: YceI family protein [Bacteroidales bacterium]